jgi:hypothetical protein
MPRDYRAEYDKYQGTPEQKKNRAVRNAARREAERDGLVRKGDGKDVDHKKPLSKGGDNSKGNLRVTSKSDNRSFPRTSTGALKRNT